MHALRNSQANLREQRTEIDISRTRLLSNTEHLAANCYEELGETIDELSIKFAQSEANFIMPDAPPEEIEESENDETLAPAPISIYHLPPDFELEAGVGFDLTINCHMAIRDQFLKAGSADLDELAPKKFVEAIWLCGRSSQSCGNWCRRHGAELSAFTWPCKWPVP